MERKVGSEAKNQLGVIVISIFLSLIFLPTHFPSDVFI